MVRLQRATGPADLAGVLGDASWVGASSFEARSAAALTSMPHDQVGGVFLVQYQTKVRPKEKADEAIRQNTLKVRQFAAKGSHPFRRMPVLPYQLAGIQNVLDQASQVEGREVPAMVIDVTCLTKAHTIGVAEWLATRKSSFPVFIQYTPPTSYGAWSSSSNFDHGYASPIFAPFGELSVSDLARPRLTFGVASLGHESVRLSHAMSLFHADYGIAMISYGGRNDDALVMAEVENAIFLDDISPRVGKTWIRETLDVYDVDAPARLISQLMSMAQTYPGVSEADGLIRAVLVPLGPKLIILSTALALLQTPGISAWMSYPIPAQYRISYSYGYGDTVLVRAVHGAID